MNPADLAERLVVSCPSIRRVILYGSRARGDNHDRADIDLAVDFGRAHTLQEWAHLQDIIEDAPTLLFIDLVFLDDISENMRKRILEEGKTLYEAEAGKLRKGA